MTSKTKLYDGDTFERHGLTFHVRLLVDDDREPPWQREEGHGPVRQCRSRDDKRPGERILAGDHRNGYWLYDWQAACRLARKDGWNAEPYGAPNRIERSVQADFDYLRRWLDDQWCYIGVVVELVDADGETVGDESLWGIESDAYDCITDTAYDLADALARQHGCLPEQCSAAWRAALHEARECRHWAARDVVTSYGETA